MGSAVATFNRKSSVYSAFAPASAPVVDVNYPGWRPVQHANPRYVKRTSTDTTPSAVQDNSPVIWEWEGRGSWRQFSKAESAEMCRIMSSPSGCGTWEARNTTYEGNVFNMQQKNVSTGNIRVIRMRAVGSEERPALMKWSDDAGGWQEDRELDLKVLIALRHGQPVEHCDNAFQVNFADNCLENELTRHAFQPSNNMLPFSRQMDWGLFQWRDQDEAWVDFGRDENMLIEKAWKRGDVSVCFAQNGHPMELSFLSWTLLNLDTHWTSVVRIGQRLAVGENTVPASPVFEYHHRSQWRCFVERVDTLLTQCFNRKQSHVTYSTRYGNFSADLESMVATNLTGFARSRLRRRDGKTFEKANAKDKAAKVEKEKKDEGIPPNPFSTPRSAASWEKEKREKRRKEKEEERVPPNPFYTPRSAARWENEKKQEKAKENARTSNATNSKDSDATESARLFGAKRKFEEEFPPRQDAGFGDEQRRRRQSSANDGNVGQKETSRKKYAKGKSNEWDNADFGSSKEPPRPPTKLPGPTDAVEDECKEIKAKLMDKLSLRLEERKALFKDLQRDLHPDKNKKDNATQLFQYLMSNKGWFLLGPKPTASRH